MQIVLLFPLSPVLGVGACLMACWVGLTGLIRMFDDDYCWCSAGWISTKVTFLVGLIAAFIALAVFFFGGFS